MKKRLVDVVTIRPKHKGRYLTGANADLRINGRKLKGVTSFNLHVNARGVAKITLEMIGDVRVLGEFAPAQVLKVHK